MTLTTIFGFPEIGLPPVIHVSRISPSKPSIRGTPILGNPHLDWYDSDGITNQYNYGAPLPVGHVCAFSIKP